MNEGGPCASVNTDRKFCDGFTDWLNVEQARPLWSPDGAYLNTATYGLPPRPAWDAMQQALLDFRHGRTSWEGWNETTNRLVL